MRLLLALFALLPGAVAEVSLKDRMTAAVAHGLAKVRANHSIANKSRRLFTPGDILPFDFELDPVEMSDCTTPTLLGGTGGDCFSICFFTTWLCEGIFDIADNICDAYADVGSVGIGAAVSAGVAAVIPGVLWDLPMAATMGLLAKEFVEPLFDQVVERVCQPTDTLGDTISLTDECMDAMKHFGGTFEGIVEKAGTDLNGMLTGNIQDCCSTVMRRRRRLGYCSNVERRRCRVDYNPITDFDDCYNPEDELEESYEEGITITVESAINLPDKDTFGETDPYIICEDEDGGDSFETEAIDEGGSHPVWNSGGSGWLEDWEKGEDVECEIWDEDSLFGNPDEYIGSFVIPSSVLDHVEDDDGDAEVKFDVAVQEDDSWWPFGKRLRGNLSNLTKAGRTGGARVSGSASRGSQQRADCPESWNTRRCNKEATMRKKLPSGNYLRGCPKCNIYTPCVDGKKPVDTFQTANFGQVQFCPNRHNFRPRAGYGPAQHKMATDLVIPNEVLRGVDSIQWPATGRVPAQQDGLWQWADYKCTNYWAPTRRLPKEDCLLLINPKCCRSKLALHIHNKPVGINKASVSLPDAQAKRNLENIRKELIMKGVCTRTAWQATPDFKVKTQPSKTCSAWAKTIKADLSSGVFSRAFEGPAKNAWDLGKYGLLVLWLKCGNAWKRVLVVSSGCSLERALLYGGTHKFEKVPANPTWGGR